MFKVVDDFDRFNHLPRDTSWQRRIWAELRYLQTLSNAQEGAYEALIQKALQVLQAGIAQAGTVTNQAAEAAEKEILAAASEAKSYEYLCIGHAHMDMNWMWGYDETINTVIDTLRTMLQIMREYPDFHFSQSQASVYQVLERYAPEMLEEIKQRVHEGRWELTTSAWVETDKNMPSGESLARQILYAKNYISRLFDVDPDSIEVDFDPDTFGHSRNVPEISAAGGLKYQYHCRGRRGDDILNRWRSESGAELLLYTDPLWYGGPIDYTIAETAVKAAGTTGMRTLLKVYGVGDHGGGPTRRDLDRIIEMNSWPVYPKFTFSTLAAYFHKAEEIREKLPVVDEEVNFLCDGCYTTQTRIKAGNRRNERALQDAELFDAMSVLYAGGQPHPEIFAEAWQRVLFNQFHDILPGSGVMETREYACATHQEASGAASARRKAAFYQLSQNMNTEPLMDVQDIAYSCGEGGGPGFGGIGGDCGHSAGLTRIFHMFNASSWERTDLSEFVVWDYEGDEDRLGVRLPGGEWLESQVVERNGFWGHQFARVIARVTVPASGWTTVLVGQKPVEPSYVFIDDMRSQHADTFVLENDKIRAVFNPATASLCSLYNKETNRELVPEGREGRFELATEAGRKSVTGWQPGMSSWFTGRQKAVAPLTVAEMRPLLTGSLRQSLEIDMNFGASTLHVVVSLDAGSSMLKYHMTSEWREFGSETEIPCLQFTMPTVCAGEKFLYDVPSSFIRREGREMDLPANRFVVAEDAADALLLTAQTKYGYRTANGRIAVTLIRAACNPDPSPEIGHHEVDFAICACPAGLSNLEYAKIVQDYEHPVYTITGMRHPGTLPAEKSSVRPVSGNVWLSAVKVSEDKKALIVRVYETEGKVGSFSVDCGFKPASVTLADRLERPVAGAVELDGNVVTAEIKKYQFLTLRLEF